MYENKLIVDKPPLVSILMNCFNGEKYLQEAIDSVMGQTYQNWEIIFWDNQSTDNSAKIFKSYKDKRLKYFYAPNHRLLYDARNYAIKKAKGDLIAFLDVDDWWHESKLEKQVHLFEDDKVGLVCSNYFLVSQHKTTVKQKLAIKKSIPTGYITNELLVYYFVGLLTILVRRTALNGLSYKFDPNYRVMGDFDFVLRISSHWRLEFVSQPLAYYRRHDDNESIKSIRNHIEEREDWYKKMSTDPIISKKSNYYSYINRAFYASVIGMLVINERSLAVEYWRKIPWSFLKLKSLVGLLLPLSIIKKIRK